MKGKQGAGKNRRREDEKFEFFDDCAICQATKKAEEEGRNLSEKELREAFAKAEEQGGIVADEWIG